VLDLSNEELVNKHYFNKKKIKKTDLPTFSIISPVFSFMCNAL
jgi:hypothetical protein